jgi:hypothetical protein
MKLLESIRHLGEIRWGVFVVCKAIVELNKSPMPHNRSSDLPQLVANMRVDRKRVHELL